MDLVALTKNIKHEPIPIHIKNANTPLSGLIGNQSFTKELDTKSQYGSV